jgi:hypothetical protein
MHAKHNRLTGSSETPQTLSEAMAQARADAFREYSDPEHAHSAFGVIDLVAAHVARVLDADRGKP